MPRTGGGITTTTRPSWIAAKRWNRAAWMAAADLVRITGPRRKGIEGEKDCSRVGCVREGRAREAGKIHGVGDARDRKGHVHNLSIDRIGACE